MIDSFPYQEWSEDVTTFWTFGPGTDHDLTGTFVLTGLGMLVMVIALIGWVVQENRKLSAQAERLRSAMSGQ